MTDKPKKLVPIEIRVQTVVELPADWNDEMCAFWFNGSSHCITNELRDMVVSEPENYCTICANAEVSVLDPDAHKHLIEMHLQRLLEKAEAAVAPKPVGAS